MNTLETPPRRPLVCSVVTFVTLASPSKQPLNTSLVAGTYEINRSWLHSKMCNFSLAGFKEWGFQMTEPEQSAVKWESALHFLVFFYTWILLFPFNGIPWFECTCVHSQFVDSLSLGQLFLSFMATWINIHYTNEVCDVFSLCFSPVILYVHNIYGAFPPSLSLAFGIMSIAAFMVDTAVWFWVGEYCSLWLILLWILCSCMCTTAKLESQRERGVRERVWLHPSKEVPLFICKFWDILNFWSFFCFPHAIYLKLLGSIFMHLLAMLSSPASVFKHPCNLCFWVRALFNSVLCHCQLHVFMVICVYHNLSVKRWFQSLNINCKMHVQVLTYYWKTQISLSHYMHVVLKEALVNCLCILDVRQLRNSRYQNLHCKVCDNAQRKDDNISCEWPLHLRQNSV